MFDNWVTTLGTLYNRNFRNAFEYQVQKKIKEFVITHEMGSKSLSTSEGVERYVSDLKRRLLYELKDNDVIIIR